MTQTTLFQFENGLPPGPPSSAPRTEYDHPGGWRPPEHIRIPGVRFAPEVPREECYSCPLARCGHPLLPDPEKENTDELLCTKDCLAVGLPLKHDEMCDRYELEGI